MIYYGYFHSGVTYGLLYWGNSSHSMKVYRLQMKTLRIIMGARSTDSCIEFFKILGILLSMAQHIYTITVFIVNNRKYFTANSELHDIITRKNKNLFQPQTNVSIYPKGPHYADTKTYNNLPTQIKLLSSNFNQCKRALKDFLQLH